MQQAARSCCHPPRREVRLRSSRASKYGPGLAPLAAARRLSLTHHQGIGGGAAGLARRAYGVPGPDRPEGTTAMTHRTYWWRHEGLRVAHRSAAEPTGGGGAGPGSPAATAAVEAGLTQGCSVARAPALRKQSDVQVLRITGARQGLDDDVRARQPARSSRCLVRTRRRWCAISMTKSRAGSRVSDTTPGSRCTALAGTIFPQRVRREAAPATDDAELRGRFILLFHPWMPL